MSNLFSPERNIAANESFADYKSRRKAAKRAAQQMALRGPFAAFGGISQRQQLRSNQDMSKRIRASDALMAHWASKRVEAMNEAKIKKANRERHAQLKKAA